MKATVHPIVLIILVIALVIALPLALPRGGASRAAAPTDAPGDHAPASPPPDLSSLNIRLSARPIRPPAEEVKKVVVLQGIRAARPRVGEPTRSVILEDDARQRVVILSTGEHGPDDGSIRAYLLADLDLESRLPSLTACTVERRCAEDRTPGTGGLGCIAFCLVETVRP